ncbi:MAG: D,D-heptose 1,7-bisphosphate phosphatase [Alphaproteobacteria bacterium CG11_big_fil_rev_8_21_14_0_20_44_7]|nr:MAG: D,D-heptose 1,7-bisphosphate phosphatase [Alphaproteobacteria bacterium CG11_big_fil_rev_8_21_14_0_20_44_7]
MNSNKTIHKALFLDRDGVINADYNYVHKISNFDFIDGIFELVRAANKKSYKVFVVTNQAGIGRGYYTEQEFLELTKCIEEKFAEENCEITKTYYSPNHPEHGIGEYKKECPDRKPNPGMILRAKAEFDLNLNDSILIGDRETDIQAAQNAGIRQKILFNQQNSEITTIADLVIKDLHEAIELL